MWLLTGPFDTESGDVTTTKTKLLKTGRKIALGRKEKPLIVNNKKISRDHCEFVVGPCTQDDVANPSFVPTIEIYNAKEKPISIDRDSHAIVVNPSSSCELMSGDKINIVVGISVVAHWRRVACFLPPARSPPSISSEDCATLGICLISSPSPLATHHLTPKYELTVPLATSLLSATQLVKAEWLQEFVRLGITSDDRHPFKLAPLEQTFTPPQESKYRPSFSPSLASSLKSFKFWEPNEERLHLLKGHRFVLLSSAEGQLDEDTRELIVRGDGEYECFPLTKGEAKWRQLLAKAKRKVDEAGLKVVIVARELVVKAAVGADRWQEMIVQAERDSLSLPFINVDALMNAVVNADASLINQGTSSKVAENESPLPDFIPNTHPDEPSLPLAQEKAPVSVDRKSPSPSAPMLFGFSIPPPPSKNLIRRTKPTSCAESILSNDDGDRAEDVGYNVPPPRSARLKRRILGPPSVREPIAEREQSQEPPHKKFKALFDASDPDKMNVDSQSVQDAYDMTRDGGSLTQTDSRPPHSHKVNPPRTLDIVAEEEEEYVPSQAVSPVPVESCARQKSPLPQATRTAHVKAAQDKGASGKPPPKPATKSKPAQGQQVDTDPAFLTALASKKGKRATEDEFDREFNKLRISKPDIHREEEDRPWEILGDFDMEASNLRGNFMVVVEMDVYRRNSDHGKSDAGRTCDGRRNFKKFKKTPTPSSRAPIEVVAKAENDYGVGVGYWKNSLASNDQETQPSTQATGASKRRALTILESDDADSDSPVRKPAKRTTRKAPQSKAKSSTTAEKLFLDSDDGDSMPTANSQGHRDKSYTVKVDHLPAKGSKRRHIIVDDDSDDGVAFKGFGKKRRVG